MKAYKIDLIYTGVATVEADSEEEAIAKAKKRLEGMCLTMDIPNSIIFPGHIQNPKRPPISISPVVTIIRVDDTALLAHRT